MLDNGKPQNDFDSDDEINDETETASGILNKDILINSISDYVKYTTKEVKELNYADLFLSNTLFTHHTIISTYNKHIIYFFARVGGTPVCMESCAGFYSSYECKETLGRGIASTVRRCVETNTGQIFAVKIVDISTERQSENEAKRLADETHSEVKILRILSGHPSIINIHDFFPTPTFLFTVFEIAPGGELFHLLNRSVTLSEKKTRQIMRQLFEGAAFMHSLRIVHRDLKLENVLCIDERRVVISDFGFAKQLKPNEKLKDLFGTPGYLSPETLRCQMYEDATGYSTEVDNWALGVIFYTLLAGYAPFYHRQQLRMMRLIQEGKYEFSKEAWDSISRDAKNLISCLLTVDVTKRMTSEEAIRHPFMQAGGPTPRKISVYAPPLTPVEIQRPLTPPAEKSKRDFRFLFRTAILSVRFMWRIKNLRRLKLCIDRNELRKRPFRNRDIRHEAEFASFAVYGHWVNRGFHYSRDMLFSNKPRPTFHPKRDADQKPK